MATAAATYAKWVRDFIWFSLLPSGRIRQLYQRGAAKAQSGRFTPPSTNALGEVRLYADYFACRFRVGSLVKARNPAAVGGCRVAVRPE
jgi:hypothetical protein